MNEMGRVRVSDVTEDTLWYVACCAQMDEGVEKEQAAKLHGDWMRKTLTRSGMRAKVRTHATTRGRSTHGRSVLPGRSRGFAMTAAVPVETGITVISKSVVEPSTPTGERFSIRHPIRGTIIP